MRKKPMYLLLVALTLAGVMAWSSVQPEDAEAVTCFICDDWVTSTSGEGIYKHNDCYLFFNDQHGIKHPCGGGKTRSRG